MDKDKDLEGKFETLGLEIGRLVDSKQLQYGNSFGRSNKILEILYPNGVPVDQYLNMLGIVRCIDKLFRIATNNDPTGENAWRDLSGYCLLGAMNAEKDSK